MMRVGLAITADRRGKGPSPASSMMPPISEREASASLSERVCVSGDAPGPTVYLGSFSSGRRVSAVQAGRMVSLCFQSSCEPAATGTTGVVVG
jgi:hypothetical protein